MPRPRRDIRFIARGNLRPVPAHIVTWVTTAGHLVDTVCEGREAVAASGHRCSTLPGEHSLGEPAAEAGVDLLSPCADPLA